MTESWISRTKRFWRDDTIVFKKFRKPIRRQVSTPILSTFVNQPELAQEQPQNYSDRIDHIEPREDIVALCETQQTCLLALPNELLDQIASSLDHDRDEFECLRSLANLSSTCRRLRAVCVPRLFRDVDVEAFNTGVSAVTRNSGFDPDDNAHGTYNEAISEAIQVIRIFQRKGFPSNVAETVTDDPAQTMTRSMLRCPRLETISIDPPTDINLPALQEMRTSLLHVIVDVRLPRARTSHLLSQLAALTAESSFTWSLAVNADHKNYELLEAVVESGKAKALCLDTNCFERRRCLPFPAFDAYPSLEELHLSNRSSKEKRIQTQVLPPSSIVPQICQVLPLFTKLCRLRVESSRMTDEVLKILPSLQTIEYLSLSSNDRGVFHTGCNTSEQHAVRPTTDMPWLQLRNLKELDIKYACAHFSIQQIVPPGLKGLRFELYGSYEHFSVEDLKWLAEHCPDLERLEINIDIEQPTEEFEDSTATAKRQPTAALLRSLSKFKHLRKLRFFPPFWNHGRFLVQPLPSVDWPVHILDTLRHSCIHLRTFSVCISHGEYPMALVSRMNPEKRPLKFTAERSHHSDAIRLRYGFADSCEMVQKTFLDGAAIGPREIVPVLPELFFDDLNEGWTFKHYEVAYTSSPVWLDTPEGKRYIEALEGQSFARINEIDT